MSEPEGTGPPADSLEFATNFGLLRHQWDRLGGVPRAVVVLGVARGGTTMVASALAGLGVALGGERISRNLEDVELGEAFERRDFREAGRIAARRDGAHRIWGFKRPGCIDYVAQIEKRLSNVHYVAVFKDVVSIASRGAMLYPDGRDAARQIGHVNDFYAKIARHLKRTRRPALLVSYEKAVMHPEPFARALAAMVDCDDEDRIANAAAAIRPDPSDYLVAGRPDRCAGKITAVEADRIVGWVSNRAPTKPGPVEVELHVRGEHVDTVTAKHDIALLGRRAPADPSARAFVFEGVSRYGIRGGKDVRAKPVPDILFLGESVEAYLARGR